MSELIAEPSDAQIAAWKQQYSTPPEFMTWATTTVLPRYGRKAFTLDVCAALFNAKAMTYFTEAEDGLQQNWCPGIVWCNPPYREIGAWVRKAASERYKGVFSCVLSHCVVAADWAQFAMDHATACWLIAPRINFLQHPDYVAYLEARGKRPESNNRDSMLWVFDPAMPGPCEFVRAPRWR